MLTKSIFVLLVWLVYISSSYDKADGLCRSYKFIRRKSRSARCTLPPFPEHGKWELMNGYATPGEQVPTPAVIIYECQPGFKLTTETNYSVCFDQWTPSPDCEELCPPLYSSATYKIKCIHKLGREVSCAEATHGTTLEYDCVPFFEAPFGHSRTLFCENGKWDVQRPMCRPVCGKKLEHNSQELIYGSKPDENIKYPWVTAVYKRKKNDYENICGGSILSETIVLTAPHCVTNQYGDALPAENYLVGAGKLYRKYKAPEDERAQYLGVSKIVIPQGYGGHIRLYMADLAVLVMKGEFVITQVVQPVCFTNVKDIRLYAGNVGEVSGWGLAKGDKPSDILRSLEIPYKYETTCAQELPADFAARYNLEDKICAGFVNKSISVCDGDSGGGLSFKHREDNRYYIHGVTSLGPRANHSCDTQQNALYTKVVSYYNFVEGSLTKYAPKVRDCILLPFPQNGWWTVDIPGMNPGDAVPSSTILSLHCSEGFRLGSATAEIECGSAYKMPTCEALCPQLHFPEGTNQYCADKDWKVIDCSNSIHLTKLNYGCPNGYTIPENTAKERTCLKGSWGIPPPECIRRTSDCGKVVDEVVNGTTLKGLENPWNVGIYNKIGDHYDYACTGSLVSTKLVVTSGQCIKEQLKDVNLASMAAGKVYINYNDSRDTRAQYSEIEKIYMDPVVERGYVLPDMVILKADSSFHYDRFVQPLCAFKIKSGNWETKMASRWKEEAIVENLEVYRCDSCWEFNKGRYNLLQIFVEKKCAKFKDNSICLDPSDTGRGLVARTLEDDRHYFFGIVSTTPNKTNCAVVWYTAWHFFHLNYIKHVMRNISSDFSDIRLSLS